MLPAACPHSLRHLRENHSQWSIGFLCGAMWDAFSTIASIGSSSYSHKPRHIRRKRHQINPLKGSMVFVLKAGPKFEVIARNDLGEDCYASPAISHGQIFFRTLGTLYCIGTQQVGDDKGFQTGSASRALQI